MNDQEIVALITNLRQENARLRAELDEVMPRYCELYEAVGLGNSADSVAVQIAHAVERDAQS